VSFCLCFIYLTLPLFFEFHIGNPRQEEIGVWLHEKIVDWYL